MDSNHTLTVPERSEAREEDTWTYVKIYWPGDLDVILRNLHYCLREAPLGSLFFKEFFYIRYRDPEQHVRLRIHGQLDCTEVVDALRNELARVEDRENAGQKNIRIEVEEYRPETERYGGMRATKFAEALFKIASRLTLRYIGIAKPVCTSPLGMAIAMELALCSSLAAVDGSFLDILNASVHWSMSRVPPERVHVVGSAAADEYRRRGAELADAIRRLNFDCARWRLEYLGETTVTTSDASLRDLFEGGLRYARQLHSMRECLELPPRVRDFREFMGYMAWSHTHLNRNRLGIVAPEHELYVTLILLAFVQNAVECPDMLPEWKTFRNTAVGRAITCNKEL